MQTTAIHYIMRSTATHNLMRHSSPLCATICWDPHLVKTWWDPQLVKKWWDSQLVPTLGDPQLVTTLGDPQQDKTWWYTQLVTTDSQNMMRPSVASVCPCLCSLLRYCLNVFLPPVPKVGWPIFLEIWNPWGKVMKEVLSDLKTFTNKGCKIATQKKFIFGQILLYQAGLFWYRSTFNGLFASISQSSMSKLFRLSESLGGKMERSGLRFEKCLIKGFKSLRQKKVFYGFFSSHLFTLFKRLFTPLLKLKCQFFLDFGIFGKSNGNKWSQIWKLYLMKGLK